MPIARAVKINGAGDTDVLSLGEIEVADPGPGQVLVEVAAAGLNRADILQRRGLYPAPPGVVPDVPGIEYAGTVAALGPGVVTRVATGDRVMGIAGGGAMATHLVVHEREIIPVPHGMSLEHAAAIPEAFLTAHDALIQAGIQMGEWVLIHAASSGVGTAAIQLARNAGAHAIGTSRSRKKLGKCIELGLEYPVFVPSKGESAGAFAREVREHTDAGAQVILDTVGASYFEENLRALSLGGRMVLIGLLGGATTQAPLDLLLQKRCTLIGTVLRSRPLEEKAVLAQRFGHRIVPLFHTGALTPVIDSIMPMAEIAAAHRRMEKNEHFGKIVLRW